MRLCAFLLALALGPLQAQAQEESNDKVAVVALLAVEISGDAPPELRTQIQSQITSGLKQATVQVVDLDELLLILEDKPQLIGCTSSACLEELQGLVGASYFIRARVAAQGAAYDVELELLTTSRSNPLVRSTAESCSVCTIAELSDLTARASKELLLPTATVKHAVTIQSSPSGAMVTIDGEDVGTTPLTIELKPGKHDVALHKDGHAPASDTVVVPDRPIDPLVTKLVLVSTGEVPVKEGTSYGTWKWAAAAGSLGALAYGGTMLAIDGDPTCGSGDARCDEQYDTFAPGLIGLSAGLVLGGAAAWMFWSEDDPESTEGLSVNLLPGGAIGHYSLSF